MLKIRDRLFVLCEKFCGLSVKEQFNVETAEKDTKIAEKFGTVAIFSLYPVPPASAYLFRQRVFAIRRGRSFFERHFCRLRSVFVLLQPVARGRPS